MNEKKYFHAIKLVTENCTACTKCVRVCPTEALRVRDDKVEMDSTRCIDCGNCVKACEYNAIQTYADKLDIIDNFKYKVAIISSSYAGQFSESIGYATSKKALLHIGFDEVAQEAMVTDMMSVMIKDYLKKHKDIRPVISSNCPAVVRLIQVRFTSLLPHLLRIEAPMSILAMYYRDMICKQKNLSEDEVGVFLIVPCVSQVTAVHQPEGTYKNLQDGAISIREVYGKVMDKVSDAEEDDTEIELYPNGLNWAISGMQADEIGNDEFRTMAVNGIHNVIDVLKKIEGDQLEYFDYIVMNSCINGCVGGVLNIENPFVATSRIKRLLQKSEHKYFEDELFYKMYEEGELDIIPLEGRPIMALDKDIKSALVKMQKIGEIIKLLPNLDCSACGSPTCAALAEDIVAGNASLDDCVVRSRKIKKETSSKQKAGEQG